ncbi:MAG TPA: hypothetical protein PLI19_05705 [Erysipelotrichaceae bacterium]|nr:hypothetical protein [Erysipelotrichaceae bacterium]HQB32810.1 hypothetical protein [Erysipelotrichaceae bacterium]
MNKKELGKVLLIIAVLLLLTGWYFNHYIWSIILILPFNHLYGTLGNEIYLTFCFSMIFLYFLIGYLGIKLWLEETK